MYVVYNINQGRNHKEKIGEENQWLGRVNPSENLGKTAALLAS